MKFLNDEGFDIPDPGSARSLKAHCPWGWTHPDGGMEKSFRVYATNTAYCFAGCGFINPVRAAAMLWDVSEQRAAKEMSARYHVATGDVDTAVEVMLTEPVVGHAELAEALRRWVQVTYGDDTKAREALIRCVSVIELITSAADAATWWDKSRQWITAATEGECNAEDRCAGRT